MERDELIALALRWGGSHRLAPPRQLGRGQAGVYLGDRQGQSVDFHDYREYQPGDDLRRVDWRAYARTGQMQLKLYREEVSPVVEIVLDASLSMGAYPGKAQAAVFLAAFLHAAVAAVGGRAALLLDGRRHAGPGFPVALAAASFDRVGHAAFPAPPPVPGKPLRFFLGDCLFPGDVDTAFATLARGALALNPVFLLSRSERLPSLRGHCRLHDVEDDGPFVDLSITGAAIDAYLARLRRHEDSLAAAAMRHGGGLLPLTVPDAGLSAEDCQALVRSLAAEEVVTA